MGQFPIGGQFREGLVAPIEALVVEIGLDFGWVIASGRKIDEHALGPEITTG